MIKHCHVKLYNITTNNIISISRMERLLTNYKNWQYTCTITCNSTCTWDSTCKTFPSFLLILSHSF